MLILTRYQDQSIIIDDDIKIISVAHQIMKFISLTVY